LVDPKTAAKDNGINNNSSAATVAGITQPLLLDYTEPHQPSKLDDFPKHVVTVNGKSKVLTFQSSWFQRFPWLHYSPELKAVLCFHCAKAESLGMLSLCNNAENTFLATGFTKWKHAIEKFTVHQKSTCHINAVSQIEQLKAPSIVSQLSAKKCLEQKDARFSLVKVFKSVRYLARQGLALRGHHNQDGNFIQLLNLVADNTLQCNFRSYLDRTTNYTSPESQNEILQLLSNAVIREIVNTIKNESTHFAIVVDGTQDCSGKEQQSICLRYVDKDLHINESFIGLYEPPDTTGKTLATMIKDALVRLDLPLAHLSFVKVSPFWD
jgi:hypothetical protein